MSTAKKLKGLVKEACKEASERGFEIVYGYWGSKRSKCCCALTALAWQAAGESIWDRDGGVHYPDVLSQCEKLGFSRDDCRDFYRGFDGDMLHVSTEEFWVAGMELANELDPEAR